MSMNCKVCGNSTDNTIFHATEMMLGLGGVFFYLQCARCSCLSLLNIPNDMSIFYPKNYYSYVLNNEKECSGKLFLSIKSLVRKFYMMSHVGDDGKYIDIINMIKLIRKFKKAPYHWIKNDLIRLNSKVLDVGCGNGFLIKDMKNYGIERLFGIDAYIENDIAEENIKIYKSDIFSFNENEFDLIMYHHVFEHVANPGIELDAIYEKLNKNGTLLIRIPVVDSFSFRKYKQNWVQLDAPRHVILYSVKGLIELCRHKKFILHDMFYDSNCFQFTGSECYSRGLKFGDEHIFTKDEISFFAEKAKDLNKINDGDSACFYFKKV